MQPRRLNIDSHRAASGVGEILGLLGGAVRGAANLPRAVKEEGASGVVQAFTDPQRFEGERRNEKYISQLAEDSMQQRIHVRELLTSDQPIEALKFAMTTREMLGMNHPGVPDEVIDKVMAPEMEMVKRTLYDPRRLGTPEQAAKLSAFVGGTPKDLRESARTQAYAGTQGAYQGKAEEETRTERETRQPRIEKLGAETQKNRSMASFYDKGGRGGAGGGVSANQERLLRKEMNDLDEEIRRAMAAKPDASGIEDIQYLVDRRNGIATFLGEGKATAGMEAKPGQTQPPSEEPWWGEPAATPTPQMEPRFRVGTPVPRQGPGNISPSRAGEAGAGGGTGEMSEADIFNTPLATRRKQAEAAQGGAEPTPTVTPTPTDISLAPYADIIRDLARQRLGTVSRDDVARRLMGRGVTDEGGRLQMLLYMIDQAVQVMQSGAAPPTSTPLHP